MKLYIKQKVFSWKDKFYVKDEFGNDRYYVEGELFSFGKKLHIYDMNNNELALVQQKVLSFLPRYFVFTGGIQRAEIVKEFTFFRNKYRIDGLGWEVDGDFMDHDYEITQMGRPIVTINKEWFTWGDSYVLDIADSVDPINALAVVLAIDCVIEMQRRASASN